MNVLRRLLTVLALWAPALASAAELVYPPDRRLVGNTGISGLWLLANLCFAGMRAQNSPSSGWRVVAFLFGFPGTLITFLVVPEGEERAYGVDIPKRR